MDIVERLRDFAQHYKSRSPEVVCNMAIEEIEKLRQRGCVNIEGAPHGFLRDSSHAEDRYVCECEQWAEQRIAELEEQLQTTFVRWQEEKESWRQELEEERRNDQYTLKLLMETTAREAKLREAIEEGLSAYMVPTTARIAEALAIPTDDTALKEALKRAKREALLEASERYPQRDPLDTQTWLRRMAEELK